MYEDFKFLNFDRSTHKIRKIRELLNRLSADYERKKLRIDNLNLKIKAITKKIEQSAQEGPITDLPDLKIISLVVTIYNQYADFEITIENIGAASSLECILEVSVEGVILDFTIPALAVAETVVLYSAYPYNPSGAEYSYTLTATADATNINQELDKSNNTLSENFIGKIPYTGVSQIIVNILNDEGKEIWAAMGASGYISVFIDDVLTPITLATNITTKDIPYSVPAGLHYIRVECNGFAQTKPVNVLSGSTSIVTFIFKRTLASTPTTYYTSSPYGELYVVQFPIASGLVSTLTYMDMIHNFEYDTVYAMSDATYYRWGFKVTGTSSTNRVYRSINGGVGVDFEAASAVSGIYYYDIPKSLFPSPYNP